MPSTPPVARAPSAQGYSVGRWEGALAYAFEVTDPEVLSAPMSGTRRRFTQ